MTLKLKLGTPSLRSAKLRLRQLKMAPMVKTVDPAEEVARDRQEPPGEIVPETDHPEILVLRAARNLPKASPQGNRTMDGESPTLGVQVLLLKAQRQRLALGMAKRQTQQ